MVVVGMSDHHVVGVRDMRGDRDLVRNQGRRRGLPQSRTRDEGIEHDGPARPFNDEPRRSQVSQCHGGVPGDHMSIPECVRNLLEKHAAPPAIVSCTVTWLRSGSYGFRNVLRLGCTYAVCALAARTQSAPWLLARSLRLGCTHAVCDLAARPPRSLRLGCTHAVCDLAARMLSATWLRQSCAEDTE